MGFFFVSLMWGPHPRVCLWPCLLEYEDGSGLGIQGRRRERAAGFSSPAGCIRLSYSEVELTRDLCIEAMSWDTDGDLSYLLTTGSTTYSLSPEPHGRTGGEQVWVHTTLSTLAENRGQLITALLQVWLCSLCGLLRHGVWVGGVVQIFREPT